MALRRLRLALIAAALVAVLSGCSEVGYNPYVQNDGHRPIGKLLEADGPEAINDGIIFLDNRFENAYN